MAGFFDILDVIPTKAPPSLVPRCGSCGLYQHCSSPKMPVDGRGKRRILVIGEAPGRNEDKEGKPFVGKTGRYFRDEFLKVGIDLREDCWMTNSLICWPHDKDGKNRPPTDKEISYCRPNVIKVIQDLDPEIILLLGSKAVSSVLSWLWKDDLGSISRWEGWTIPCQKLNAWICPLWHPSYVVRGKDAQEEDGHFLQRQQALREMLYRKRIAKVAELQGRPWKTVPHWDKGVDVILDPNIAASKVREFNTSLVPVAIDFETDRLKPDRDEAAILTCALSDGKKTIAYPWVGEAIPASLEFLASGVGKVASNMKFEQRVSLARIGRRIKNWVWDTMVAAHVLDNRAEITSIKFQSFVLLGQEDYDSHVKPYMRSKGSNEPNRLKEANLGRVLVYNGLDSLLESKVAQIQAKQLGIEL